MSSVPKGATRSVGQFEKLAKVGEGTYGSVYKARDRETGGLVALKRVKLGGSGFDREGMPLTSLREIALLRRLRHPNVVRLHEVAVGSKLDSVFLVFEYCEHELGRLLDAMPTPFAPSEVKCLMRQLMSSGTLDAVPRVERVYQWYHGTCTTYRTGVTMVLFMLPW